MKIPMTVATITTAMGTSFYPPALYNGLRMMTAELLTLHNNGNEDVAIRIILMVP